MDIARLSMDIAQSRMLDQVGTKVLDMNLDQMEQQGADLIQMMDRSMMENSVYPNLGANIDIQM